jgi:hypothetical protein
MPKKTTTQIHDLSSSGESDTLSARGNVAQSCASRHHNGMFPPDRDLPLSDIYIDESSQTRNRFLLLGGIIVPSGVVEATTQLIEAARFPEILQAEMKWGKVSKSMLPAYKRVIDTFFDDPAFLDVHFHCLVVDSQKVDHQTFNRGSGEIGFSKEIYQLASKFARLYPGLFHLYPDHRDTNQTADDLRSILNAGRRKLGDGRWSPFRRCHFRDSSKTPHLQLVDILLGAAAYRVNGHVFSKTASPAKIELSDHVLARAGVKDALRDTSIKGKYTIWHRKLRWSKRRPAALGQGL